MAMGGVDTGAPTSALVLRYSREVFQLLAREANARELVAVISEVRSSVDDPATQAEIMEIVYLAEPVLAALERRKRREAELTALSDTALDLAGEHDLDAVLQTIARRTHQLLNADVAYVSLIDEDREDTYLRVTVGSVSPRFQQLRMHIGDGLGGLVAQAGAPVATDAYFDESRIRHTEAINDAVRDEGLVSILGVPLLLGEKVTGVLYAASRTRRVFSTDEIAFACSLAAHAAIAYENARLMSQMHTALNEINRVNEVVRDQTTSVAAAADAHVRMSSVVLHGGDPQELAHTLADALGGCALCVVDVSGALLAHTDVTNHSVVTVARELCSNLRSETRAYTEADMYAVETPLVSGSGGVIVVDPGPGGLTDTELRILERAGMVLGLMLMIRRVVAETENRLQRDFLDDLISASGRTPRQFADRAQELGIEPGASHIILVARDPEGRDLGTACAAWMTGRRGIYGKHEGDLVVLIPGQNASEAAASLTRGLTGAVRSQTTVAAAGPIVCLDEVPRAHAEARQCLEIMNRLGVTGRGYTLADLGVAGLVMSTAPDAATFIDRHLGPLLEWDTQRNTELVATLDAYLAAGRNLTAAARALHIHSNTMRQRLDRIGQLLGTDWAERPNIINLEVALQLRSLAPPA